MSAILAFAGGVRMTFVMLIASMRPLHAAIRPCYETRTERGIALIGAATGGL